ncbi:MAG: hypothetical protein ACUVXA_18750 [Candidatus Jordarchaeum sp.]|uniref:hypothetical protein n=1 Tax=Candidatus Jordarchaeum sp. TaxID=2823881 RepID=UPI00404AC89F
MEKSFGEIAEKIAKFMPKKCYVAFLENSGNLLWSSLTSESADAVSKLRGVFPVWDIGDYQLKKLSKSNLLVYKVSPRIVLAIESYEKEGVLIVTGKRLEENYLELFSEIESQLPAPKEEEVIEVPTKEVSLGLVKEGFTAEEIGVAEPTVGVIPSEIVEGEMPREPSTVTPPAGEVEETITVSFPILVDNKILKKVKEPMAIAILQLCDGDHTIDDIAEELGISKARAMITTGDFSAKGAIRYISGIRKIKR